MECDSSDFTARYRLVVAPTLLLLMLIGSLCVSAQAPAQDKSAPGTTSSQRPPSHNWKIEEFEADLKKLDGNRSFERGRTVFQESLCTVCHRVGDTGGDLGPDLSKPKKTRTRRELLREILEPSRDIEPEFRTYVVLTLDGHVISGVLKEQTDEQVTIRARPVGTDATRTVPRKNIDTMELIEISMMPDELLNRLTRDDVLDLLAYVEAKGDPKSPLFRRQ